MNKTITVLAIGDIVGASGCGMLKAHLPLLKQKYHTDIVIVNGENSAEGNGITPASCRSIFDCGADVITTGNHVFRRKEIFELLDTSPYLIRPANYPNKSHGKGVAIIDRGAYRVGVINLMGRVYLDDIDSPFDAADQIIKDLNDQGITTVFVDFHAEATSEKKAMAFYLDGRTTALFGTHTHVQTADETILPGGCGYITDLGMTGPELSVLGVKPELSLARIKDDASVKFENANTPAMLNGCIFTVDLHTAKTLQIKRINIR